MRVAAGRRRRRAEHGFVHAGKVRQPTKDARHPQAGRVRSALIQPWGLGQRGEDLFERSVRFVRPPGRDLARALRAKLNWHGTDVPRSP